MHFKTFFEADMAPSWLPESKKIDKKSMPKSIEKVMHLGIDFWKDFNGLLEENWRHVGIKIDQKSMPRRLPMLTSFFLRILLEFGSRLGPPESNLELAG